MKVLLEILDDASQLLAALDRIDDLRPETRDKIKVLLEGLCDESTRLLRSDQDDDVPAVNGERFERRCREWLLQRSLEALAAQEYDAALDYLREGAEAFPEDDELLTHLGLVHWELQDFEQAADAYGRAMAAAFPTAPDGQIDWRDPSFRGYLRAMEGRALCFHRLGRLDEALELFDALANMNAIDYGGCRYMAGEIRHSRDDLSGAIEDYRLGPVEPATLYNLGLALFQDDQTEAAASTFIRAFVANIHVVEIVAGRHGTTESCVPGYLGSRQYAGDFVAACDELWRGKKEAIDFMETCYDHPLVQSYLTQCREDGGASMLENETVIGGQTTWLDALTDAHSVDGLAESVVKRFNS